MTNRFDQASRPATNTQAFPLLLLQLFCNTYIFQNKFLYKRLPRPGANLGSFCILYIFSLQSSALHHLAIASPTKCSVSKETWLCY